MIDTHIHIIPGVDDGAADLQVSKQMLNFLIDQGVTEIIATPHFNPPRYDNQGLLAQYHDLREMIQLEEMAIKLQLGNEIRLSEEGLEGIKAKEAKTMGDSNYLLIELPTYHFYPFHELMLYDLLELGYKIILAHVERYPIFQEKPEKLLEFVQAGVFAQLSASYIIERQSRKKAFAWLESGLIHLVASDGHNMSRRPPVLKKAYQLVDHYFDSDSAEMLFKENPSLLIKNQELEVIDTKKASLLDLINLKFK